MRIPTTQDYERILAALPNNSDNAPVYGALMQLLNESKVEMQPYVFTLTFGPLVVAATAAPQSFIVDSSAPFMLVSQNYQSDIAGATSTMGTTNVPNASVQIQDQSSNRNWQAQAVPIPSIFGNGQRPYFLPQPRLIPANTTITVSVTSFEAAVTPTVRLSFIGFRYYTSN